MIDTISSKEVAEMLGKRHDNFLRDIRKYIDTLGEEDAPKYFVQGVYTDKLGKERFGFSVTLAGCEMIAGRMLGEKRTAFTEKYLKVFQPEEAPTAQEKDYTVKEVAKILGINDRTVYRHISRGKLATIQKEVVTTVTAVTESALNAFKAERGLA